MAFGVAKAVLFIEASLLQGVLIRGVPLYMYMSLCKCALCTRACVCHECVYMTEKARQRYVYTPRDIHVHVHVYMHRETYQ